MSMRLRSIFLRVIGIFNLAIMALYVAVPVLQPQFTDENMFLESAGAIFFFTAFLLGAAAWSIQPAGTVARKAGWLIPLLGLLGFLDDTSFFGLLEGEVPPGRPPIIVGTSRLPAGTHTLYVGPYRVDALHDFLAVAMKAIRDTGSVTIYAASAILIGAAAALAFAFRRRYMPAIMALCRRYPAFDYLRLTVIFIAISMVLDLGLIRGDLGQFIPELLEANGGICLAFGAAALGCGEEPD